MPPRSKNPGYGRLSELQACSTRHSDTTATSRFVLEQENAELKRRLEEALGERDEARKIVSAMRSIVG